MAGGDHVTLHNSVRDLIFDYCQRAQVRPQLEAAGILDGRRRPADVLVRDAASLLARLPDGSRPHSTSPIALDIALGDNHWDDPASGWNGVLPKSSPLPSPRHFAARLGSSTSLVWEARRDPSVLAGMVAVVEGLSHEAVKGRLADQLAVPRWRSGTSRRALPSDHISFQRDAVAALCLDP